MPVQKRKQAGSTPREAGQPNIESSPTMYSNEAVSKRLSPLVDERPYKKGRLYYSLSDTVKLAVGKEETTLVVYTDALVKASPFFEAACKPEWLKSDGIIKLPEDNAEAVRAMVYWIYHDKIFIDKVTYERSGIQEESCDEAMKSIWGLLSQLYVLGQKYQMPHLQDDAIDGLIQCQQKIGKQGTFPSALTRYVYDNTPDVSPLRKLLVRFGLCSLIEKEFFDSYAPAYTRDITLALLSADVEHVKNVGNITRCITIKDFGTDNCPDLHQNCSGKIPFNRCGLKAVITDSEKDDQKEPISRQSRMIIERHYGMHFHGT